MIWERYRNYIIIVMEFTPENSKQMPKMKGMGFQGDVSMEGLQNFGKDPRKLKSAPHCKFCPAVSGSEKEYEKLQNE